METVRGAGFPNTFGEAEENNLRGVGENEGSSRDGEGLVELDLD